MTPAWRSHGFHLSIPLPETTSQNCRAERAERTFLRWTIPHFTDGESKAWRVDADSATVLGLIPPVTSGPPDDNALLQTGLRSGERRARVLAASSALVGSDLLSPSSVSAASPLPASCWRPHKCPVAERGVLHRFKWLVLKDAGDGIPETISPRRHREDGSPGFLRDPRGTCDAGAGGRPLCPLYTCGLQSPPGNLCPHDCAET